jgi:hypothetical protein
VAGARTSGDDLMKFGIYGNIDCKRRNKKNSAIPMVNAWVRDFTNTIS